MTAALDRLIHSPLRERIGEMIAIYDVHATLPVPIRQLARDLGFDVRFRERMSPLLAWATLEDDRPVMGMNASISTRYQRYAMGHEIGHYLAGHLGDGELHTLSTALRPGDAAEETADAIAALLLVPGYTFDEYDSTSAIARACEAPRRLVDLRASLSQTRQ